MLFKRSADIIIKGHHQTGRPCGLDAAGKGDGRPLKKRRRGGRKAVFKVGGGGQTRSLRAHYVKLQTLFFYGGTLRDEAVRKLKGKKRQKNATLFERSVNMTAIMRSSDSQTHP